MTAKKINYVFLDRNRDEGTGAWVYSQIATAQLDSDAQAELYVTELRDEGKIPTDLDGNPKHGCTIHRGGVEWYSRA